MKRYKFRKPRRYMVGLILIIAAVVITFVVLIVYNNNQTKFNRSYNDFTTLTIREVFENALSNLTTQFNMFTPPVLIGSDDIGNTYSLTFSDDQLLMKINGQVVQDTDTTYEEIYAKALYNIVMKIPPSDFSAQDPKALSNYLTESTYYYVRKDGTDFLVLTGKNVRNEATEFWFMIRKVNGKLRVNVEKIVVDGRTLTPSESKLLLSKIYKKTIDTDLIDAIKNSYLKGFTLSSIGETFEKLPNARWNVKDENQNLVELNATEVIDGKEVALTIGFKIDEVGQTVVPYFLVNGKEIESSSIPNYLKYIYSKYGRISSQEELQALVDRILRSNVPNTSETFGKLFSEKLSNLEWNISYKTTGTEIRMDSITKEGSEISLTFLFSNGSIYLVTGKIDGKEEKPATILSELAKAASNKMVEVVQKGRIIKGSTFSNNKSAFENFLKSPKWYYDEKMDRVILTGTGKYSSQQWNFKFVFEIFFNQEPVLEYVYMNDTKVIDELVDYIISQVFNVDTIGSNLVELVKSTIFYRNTYEDILGPTGWTLDRNSDSVVFSNKKLKVRFYVEPSGKVKISELTYLGKDYSSQSFEIIKLLEEGENIESVLGREQPKEQPVEQKATEETQQQSTETETEDYVPQYGQF
ncbi:MAG TPA: hypothetical protein PK716_05870 [Fervidobacterium sp.]|nr:hypothetical protein [Fervidobacterium sp.]HOM74589.1 hypothetical protein [Fervidobacterium sp.]